MSLKIFDPEGNLRPVTLMSPKKAKLSDLSPTQKDHYDFLKKIHGEIVAIRYLQLLARYKSEVTSDFAQPSAFRAKKQNP